ncbi:MAG: hypothetical protein HND52_20145 [Ignavibacteriae bacterium]|jgi:DNA-directed RNA polymerase subunit RPC12/RpoP|nr:hypothetical protein [Ignavibacteriota bacterium]NOH00282.1 hypothetical protein [Ignavibacteriota bacterium]
MSNCKNHPNKTAYTICNNCKEDFCEDCLDEGKEFYYCKNSECQQKLKDEFAWENISLNMVCPNCESELELSEKEKGKVHCPECESLIDFNFTPPKVLIKDNYTEILSTLNQGDIALIKSILDDGNIDYHILGENFLGVRPLLEPARILVNDNQIDETKELLKNIELDILGVSTKHDE